MSTRELVDYSDIDDTCVPDEKYRCNLLYMYPHLDPLRSVPMLEWAIDYAHVSGDERLAFCQVTRVLPEDVQRIIFSYTF